MTALIFMPNMGKRPVKRKARVTVTLKNGALLEGEARDFKWQHKGKETIEGWRQMMAGEVLHDENRPKPNSIHRRIFDGQ
jgi:hypothetical protein